MTEPSPASVLRTAAATLRTRAAAATPGPWQARHQGGSHDVIGGAYPLPGKASDNRKVHRDGGYAEDWPVEVVNPAADADWIALMDPGMGPLLADWLDAVAAHLEATTHPDWQDILQSQALAFARKINSKEQP